MPDKRVTLREASALLGVSEGAIRKRVARNTIRSEMGEDGLRYVWVPEAEVGTDGGTDERADASSTRDRGRDELVEELRDRVRYLEGQLDTRTEELREHRRLLAGLIERVPELEAPRERQEGPETVGEEPEKAEPRSAAVGSQEGPQPRPWWRMVFGG